MLVKVRSIPIRYGSKTYLKNEEFEIKKEYYDNISQYVDVIEDEIEENEGVNQEVVKMLKNLTYHELKTYLKEQGLNTGERRKHDEILEFAIQELA